jgi:twitching motility protein PilJ
MPPAHADHTDNSIITESLPTEATDFAESRQLDDEVGRGALPLIGNRSIGDQQRILVVLVGLGLLGLIALTIFSIASAGRGAAQVAASGQALMQSQRLAKSVTQALIGSAQAFPEMRESAEVLARNVRGLKTGEGSIAAAPDSVQSVLEPVLPLVDRAEKNANTVLAQQAVLTQVGQSLRTINRQSADLLEIA